MRKKIVAIMMLAMAMSLTACGGNSGSSNTESREEKEDKKDDKKEDKKDDKKDDKDDNSSNSGSTSNDFCGVGYSEDDEYILFNIRTEAWLCEDAWIGVCPEDYYIDEAEADDVDEYYEYCVNYSDADGDKEPYTFELYTDFGGIEPGNYTMVLCNCDADGDIIAQWPLIYKGEGKYSIKLEDAIYNEFAPTSDPDEYFDWDDDNSDSSFSKYGEELSITSEYDLVCVENEILVCKYTGTSDDLEEDSIFIDDYSSDSIYYVWNGFFDDGSINQISGYTCLYYFYSDWDMYQEGLASAQDSWGFRGQNDDYMYFTVNTTEVEGSTWEECIEAYSNGDDFRHPHFSLVE